MKRNCNDSGRLRSSTWNSSVEEPGASNTAYLRQRQVEVRREIQSTLAALKQDVLTAADPKAWVRISPWGTVGVVAATAFAAATLVMPASGSGVGGEVPVGDATGARVQAASAPPAAKSGAIWGAFSALLYGVGRFVLTEALNAAFRPDLASDSTMADDTAEAAAEFEPAAF